MSIVPVIIFYSFLFLIVYFNRDKFDIQAKIIALYRTKFGIKWMDKIAKFSPRFWKVFGYTGVATAYLGLMFISYVMIKALIDMILAPGGPAAVSLVIPGVKMPGSAVFIPFWSGIISIFIVAFIHEFCHGIIARLYDMKVKNSGIVFFGPIIGAFVEPDEKELKSRPKIQQLSVFAAGPFSNIVLGVFVMLFMVFAMVPFISGIVEPVGISIDTVQADLPAQISGMQGGETIVYIDGQRIVDVGNFSKKLSTKGPGDVVVLGTESEAFTLTLDKSPVNESLGYMGVTLSQKQDIKPEFRAKYGILSNIIFPIFQFLQILFMLTLGIGFANLLPLGPVDGGRILQVTLYRFMSKLKADMLWKKISMFTLLILLINLFYPAFRSIIMSLF